MIERLAIVVVVVGVAALVVRLVERRLPRSLRLPVGITLVTGPDCALCGPVARALESGGVSIRTIGSDEMDQRHGVRAVPTVLVADEEGRVVMRRSGRSALADAADLVAAARGSGRVREAG